MAAAVGDSRQVRPAPPHYRAGMGISREERPGLAGLFADMAASCARLEAPTYALLSQHVADSVNDPGPLADLLDPYAEAAVGDMLPLRFLGAIHRLALERRAPELALFFASMGGTPPTSERARAHFVRAFEDVVAHQGGQIAAALEWFPQTNEVGRTEGLFAVLRRIQHSFGLPVRLHEIGTSAGLSLRVDELVHRGIVSDAQPTWGDLPSIIERVGVDLELVDINSDNGRLHLTSFIWPDHVQRFERLRGALAVAQQIPADLSSADAVEHVRSLRLQPGTTLVLWHSAMWMYLAPEQRAEIVELLAALGDQATAEAPLVHVALEPIDTVHRHVFRLQVATWPALPDTDLPPGLDVLWGTAPPSGTPVDWAVPCAGAITHDDAGRLLVVRRGQEPAKGTWSIPGGRVEPGESWAQAAIRELHEETGLHGEITGFAGLIERAAPDGATYVIADYRLRAAGEPRAADDADDAQWVDRQELSSLTTSPGLVEALRGWDALPT